MVPPVFSGPAGPVDAGASFQLYRERRDAGVLAEVKGDVSRHHVAFGKGGFPVNHAAVKTNAKILNSVFKHANVWSLYAQKQKRIMREEEENKR